MITITPAEAFKSKQNFSEFMEKQNPPIILSTLADYPKANGKNIVTLAELTQNFETLTNTIGSDLVKNLSQAPFIVWIVANERENVLNAVSTINKYSCRGFGIFVFKACLNEDKIEFKCLLKPQITKQTRNSETQAKTLQLEYWQKYFEKCDELQSDMQINPKPQHFAYIPIGKAGVQIMQTINTADNYIATELLINNKKEIFNELVKNKVEIEKLLGELNWYSPENIKSSKIRKTYNINIDNKKDWETATCVHIRMAETFKEVFKKYL